MRFSIFTIVAAAALVATVSAKKGKKGAAQKTANSTSTSLKQGVTSSSKGKLGSLGGPRVAARQQPAAAMQRMSLTGASMGGPSASAPSAASTLDYSQFGPTNLGMTAPPALSAAGADAAASAPLDFASGALGTLKQFNKQASTPSVAAMAAPKRFWKDDNADSSDDSSSAGMMLGADGHGLPPTSMSMAPGSSLAASAGLGDADASGGDVSADGADSAAMSDDQDIQQQAMMTAEMLEDPKTPTTLKNEIAQKLGFKGFSDMMATIMQQGAGSDNAANNALTASTPQGGDASTPRMRAAFAPAQYQDGGASQQVQGTQSGYPAAMQTQSQQVQGTQSGYPAAMQTQYNGQM